MLELRLLGAAQALVHGRPLHGFPHQLPYLLLCYLALNRTRCHAREPLAALFWPEQGSEAALKQLRNVLWRLRHELEAAGAAPDAYLAGDEHHVALCPRGPFRLDVEAFETAVGLYCDRPGHHLLAAEARALEAAVSLYSGELLEGVYEDWCLHERERLRLLHLTSLGRLMEFYGARCEYERALALANRILVCDPLREHVHRAAMRLAWLSGDRSGALERYRQCEAALRDELGVAPLQETTDLYEQIRATPPPLPASPPPPAAATLNDRLNRLAALLDDSRREIAELQQLLLLIADKPPGAPEPPC